MVYVIINSQGVYSGAMSRYDNPPRPLLAGESVIEAEWDDTLNQPIGVPMPTPTPQADWPAFVAGIPSLTFYASKILAGPSSNLFTALTHAIDSQNTERINQLLPAVQTVLSLTDEDLAEFQQLADEHNIDITIP